MDHETDFYQFETIDGAAALSHDEGVWVGHNLARVLDLSTGDTLTIKALGQTNEAPIAGVVNWATGVLVPATLMQTWSPLGVQLANITLIRAEAIDDVRRELIALDGVGSVEVVEQTNQDIVAYTSLYTNFSYLFQSFGYILTLVVLFITIRVNIHERREELAIMRSMGSSIGDIAGTITWETMTVTILSMIIGLPLSWRFLEGLMQNYDTDFTGFITYIAPQSYVVAGIGIIVIVLFSQWLGLRNLRKLDLGYLSKSLSM